jgi:hypothetical protein
MGTVSCVISSRANEDASIAMIRKWVGVQPAPSYPSSSGVTYYDYREDGSGRTAIVGDAAVKSANTEGQSWTLTVMQQSNNASVQLMHFLVPTLRSPN